MSALTTTHVLDCDVLVAGGGPAGVPCAIAAARGGAKVVLVQDRPVLGGNASSEIRMHIVGADQHGGRGRGGEMLSETREGGIMEEIRLELAVRNPQRSAVMLDLVLYEMVRAEANITLLLNTAVVAAEREGERITCAIAERISTEDRFRINAKVFVDCTGDGRLGAEAGAAFRHGREGKADFGETYAKEKGDRKTLGSTILFTARKHERPMPFVAPKWVRKFRPEDFKFRPYKGNGPNMGFEYGYWWAEWGGQLDTIKDNERIKEECLAITLGIWDYFKNGPDKELAANWALDWFGWIPGKRESRRFLGQHVLTEQDLLSGKAFADAIAYGGWKIDIHPPEGVDLPEEPPFTPFDVPWVYDIPLRSCVARDVENLMFAGRCHSATHVAFASTRVMATCAVMGQGVGTAAAYAVRKGVAPAGLAGDAGAMRAIQQQLLRDDCYLVGVTNADEGDLARSATVTASSSQGAGEPTQVISGQTRSVHGPKAAPPERAHAGVHRWLSDPAAGLPAWIELRWEKPVEVGSVQVVFDSGLWRELTLSQSDGCTARMLWGQAQPEVVRDYEVQVAVQGAWRTVAAVEGNYQRLRRHGLAEKVTAEAVRIVVKATNGVDHARVMEVRVHVDSLTR